MNLPDCGMCFGLPELTWPQLMPRITKIIDSPRLCHSGRFPTVEVMGIEIQMASPPCLKYEADPESTLAFELAFGIFNHRHSFEHGFRVGFGTRGSLWVVGQRRNRQPGELESARNDKGGRGVSIWNGKIGIGWVCSGRHSGRAESARDDTVGICCSLIFKKSYDENILHLYPCEPSEWDTIHRCHQ